MSSSDKTAKHVKGIEYFVKKSAISNVFQQYCNEKQIPAKKVEDSRLALLSSTVKLWKKYPETVNKAAKTRKHIVLPSYVCLTNIDPSEVDAKISVLVHDLYRFFSPNSKLGRFNIEHAVRNLKKADKVIVNSEKTRTTLEETVFHSTQTSFELFEPRVDPSFYPENKAPGKVELPENYILYVGSFVERKNIEYLADVLSELPEDIELVVAGHSFDPERKQELLDKASRKQVLDRVNFTGYLSQTDLRRTYSNALAYFHPAFRGGYEMTPVEAEACGTPAFVYKKIPSSKEASHVFSDFHTKKLADRIKEVAV